MKNLEELRNSGQPANEPWRMVATRALSGTDFQPATIPRRTSFSLHKRAACATFEATDVVGRQSDIFLKDIKDTKKGELFSTPATCRFLLRAIRQFAALSL
jgi:hypothetical protein